MFGNFFLTISICQIFIYLVWTVTPHVKKNPQMWVLNFLLRKLKQNDSRFFSKFYYTKEALKFSRKMF